MEATGHLITSHLQIPADAVAHGLIRMLGAGKLQNV